jgi:hypothetical protein
MTGVRIAKKDPTRQVAKSAVLGLGFCMSAFGYALVMLKTVADPLSGVTEKTLRELADRLSWHDPGKYLDIIIEKTGCSRLIAICSYHIHKLFNESYPEFGMTAEWIVNAVNSVAACGGDYHRAEAVLRRAYMHTAAPDFERIGLVIDSDHSASHPSVRVQCGPWPATVCWREPAMRRDIFSNNNKPRLTIRKALGFDKPFTKQLAIENVTQAAARNALCYGLLDLKNRFGITNVLHIHDEVMIICDRNRQAVMDAKKHLLDVFGPKSSHPLSWAVLIKPDEVSVTRSLWESEDDIKWKKNPESGLYEGGNRWGRIEANAEDMFANLP